LNYNKFLKKYLNHQNVQDVVNIAQMESGKTIIKKFIKQHTYYMIKKLLKDLT